jgi:hypothetical protein
MGTQTQLDSSVVLQSSGDGGEYSSQPLIVYFTSNQKT